jgi:hypothetical protein
MADDGENIASKQKAARKMSRSRAPVRHLPHHAAAGLNAVMMSLSHSVVGAMHLARPIDSAFSRLRLECWDETAQQR